MENFMTNKIKKLQSVIVKKVTEIIDNKKEEEDKSNIEYTQKNEISNVTKENNFIMPKIEQIELDPEFAKSFSINNDVLDKIKKSIIENGYDKSQPVVVWQYEKEKYLLVDGHTRRKAAEEIGLIEIPVCIMDFENHQEAHYYTFKRQVERRNLSSKELIRAIQMQPKKNGHDGSGRADEIMAKELGVSSSTVTHTKHVLKNASISDIEAIEKEEKTINQVYNEIKLKKKQSDTKENENKIEIVENENINNIQGIEEQKKISSKKSIKNKIKAEEIMALLKEYREDKSLELIKEKFSDKLTKKLLEKYFEKDAGELKT